MARGARYPETMMTPHVAAESLDEVARQLVGMNHLQGKYLNQRPKWTSSMPNIGDPVKHDGGLMINVGPRWRSASGRFGAFPTD